MGCDIHLYVEGRKRGTTSWQPYGGRFSERIYGMFAKLADVRNYSGITPISQPRGVPSDVSWSVKNDYCYFVVDEPTEDESCILKGDALEYIQKGWSSYFPPGDSDGRFITRPDWHSASYVPTDEFEVCVHNIFLKDGVWHGDYTTYRAVLAMMRELELCDVECRAVFWFDN